jgi:hypothetical protein
VNVRAGRSIAAWVVAVFAVGLALGAARSGGRISTDDRNGDGRPDVWRMYDAAGHLVEVAVDSNFDGRSDVREIYTNGHLTRRESDRNYDDRVDLIEDFDATTDQRVRSTVDANYDGTADLLVLFADGRPVYSEWAVDRRTATPIAVPASTRELRDPFAGDRTVRSIPTASGASSVAIVNATAALDPIAVTSDMTAAATFQPWPSSRPRAPGARVRAPRGPPIA